MNCPVCSVELKMTDRQGVEIDYCPQCRGVWLDRGELDKIIERSASLEAGRPVEDRPRGDRVYEERPREYRDRDEYDYKRKKRGFLGDLFDFD